MTPLTTFITLAGLTGPALCFLALAMPRHNLAVFVTQSSPMRGQTLRLSGWFLLAASLLLAVTVSDGGVSLVSWFALLTVQAFAITMILTYAPRLIPWWAGLTTVIALVAAAQTALV